MTGGGDDVGGLKRPSFASFLRRSKDALAGRKKTVAALQSSPSESGDTLDDGSTTPPPPPKGHDDPEAKSRHRRQQVRRAQIQHRQRKANYARELELDVARTRSLIAQAVQDCSILRSQNDILRARLLTPAAAFPPSLPQPLPLAAQQLPTTTVMSRTGAGSLFDNIDVDDIVNVTLSLDVDSIMQTPCFQISSSPSEQSFAATSMNWVFPPDDGEGGGRDNAQGWCGSRYQYRLPDLTPEQVQLAVNFILALEHTCWNHFHYPDFNPSATASDASDADSGHVLMATTLALRTAPQHVFDQLKQAATSATKKRGVSVDVGSTGVQEDAVTWQVSGLTLRSLHALASSLSAPDVELTPVQAFFELVARYTVEILLQASVLEALKMQLLGVVKCQHYGATIERAAFESVVARVLGPSPPLPQGSF